MNNNNVKKELQKAAPIFTDEVLELLFEFISSKQNELSNNKSLNNHDTAFVIYTEYSKNPQSPYERVKQLIAEANGSAINCSASF